MFDKAFGKLLKIQKKMLPKPNKLPTTTYEAKKIVYPLGLQIEKIHACPNDVMHLTKNLCVNLLGFMGVFGKPKDTLEAREDLKRMKEQDNLHP